MWLLGAKKEAAPQPALTDPNSAHTTLNSHYYCYRCCYYCFRCWNEWHGCCDRTSRRTLSPAASATPLAPPPGNCSCDRRDGNGSGSTSGFVTASVEGGHSVCIIGLADHY